MSSCLIYFRGSGWTYAAVLLGAAVAGAAPDPAQRQLRQAAARQRTIQQKSETTRTELDDVAAELAANRLQQHPLGKQVNLMTGVLRRTGQEYIGKAARDMQALVYVREEAERRRRLAELATLQGTILELLDSIRNTELAAAASRLQYKFQMALSDQKTSLAETKRLVFDRKARVPMGRAPGQLSRDERKRLQTAAGFQRVAEKTLESAAEALRQALDASAESDPAQAEKLREWLDLLRQRAVADAARRASREILNNMVTQSLKTQQQVIDAIDSLVRRMQGRPDAGADEVHADFAKLKNLLQDLKTGQETLHAATQRQVTGKLDHAELRVQEAQQHQLAEEAGRIRDQLDEAPLAKSAAEQARVAMLHAEQDLKGNYPGDAVENQALAEKALGAAILAVDTATLQGDEFARLDPEQLKHEQQAVTALISGVTQLLKKQEPLRDETAQAAKDGEKGVRLSGALGAEQEAVQSDAVALQDAEKSTFELRPQTVDTIDMVDASIGVAARAMGRAVEWLEASRPGDAVRFQETAIKNLKDALSLLHLTAEALEKLAKAVEMQARARRMAEVAGLQADLLSQVDRGEPLEDVRNVQQQLAGMMAGMAPNAAAAMEQAEAAMAEVQTAMQQAMNPAAEIMKEAAALMEKAAEASEGDLGEQLAVMASNQVALAQDVEENANPEKLPGWDQMQQEQQDALVEMMDAVPFDGGAGPPADEAVEKMEEALDEMQQAKKEAEEGIVPPMEKARTEMLAALTTMQTAATEMFQVAQEQAEEAQTRQQEAEATAEYQEKENANELAMLEMPEAGPGEQGGQPPPNQPPPKDDGGGQQASAGNESLQQGGGQGGGHGGAGADLLDPIEGEKWDVDFAKRKRVGFEQKMEQALPPQYRGVVEGYFRRLAVEGSR